MGERGSKKKGALWNFANRNELRDVSSCYLKWHLELEKFYCLRWKVIPIHFQVKCNKGQQYSEYFMELDFHRFEYNKIRFCVLHLLSTYQIAGNLFREVTLNKAHITNDTCWVNEQRMHEWMTAFEKLESFSLLKNLRGSCIYHGHLLLDILMCILLEQEIKRFYLLPWFCGFLRCGGIQNKAAAIVLFRVINVFSHTAVTPGFYYRTTYRAHTPVSSFFTAPAIIICKSVSPYVHYFFSNVLLARVDYETGSQFFFPSTASTITTVPFKSQVLLADTYSHLAILTTIFTLSYLPHPPLSTLHCISWVCFSVSHIKSLCRWEF